MRLCTRTVFGFVLVGSLAALSLSIWPGMLSEAIFIALLIALMTAIVWLPIGLIASLVVAAIFYRRYRQGQLGPFPHVAAMAIGVVIFVTFGLLACEVPRRVAFLLSRSTFQVVAATAPQSVRGIPFDKRLGIYQVDQYAADPRGGVYFRVFEGADGIGPDTMSYGFVKVPNESGTPFGAARYRVGRVIGDWYWFMASDDWW